MIDARLQIELRKRFNPEGSPLRLHQLRMLEMLQSVDKICKENNITYWLSSGTCLGAVRHGGFIPWDDDVDIEMLKPDFCRFKKVMKNNINKGIAFQTHESDPEYFAPYGKIRDLNSVIEEKSCHDRHYKYRGIYIDVFVIEPSISRIIARISGGMQNRLQYPLSKIQNRILRKSVTNSMFFVLSKCVYPILSFITNWKYSKKLRHIHGSGFVGPRYATDLLPVKYVIFEGQLFPIPQNSHHYLKILYGNYMSIPELQKIHTHLSDIIMHI